MELPRLQEVAVHTEAVVQTEILLLDIELQEEALGVINLQAGLHHVAATITDHLAAQGVPEVTEAVEVAEAQEAAEVIEAQGAVQEVPVETTEVLEDPAGLPVVQDHRLAGAEEGNKSLKIYCKN